MLTPLVAAIVLLLASPAGAAPRFGPPTQVSASDGRRYQDPQVAVGPGGVTAAVWARTTFSSNSDPFNHATVQFRWIHPNGESGPTLSFDAGSAAAYYVDPVVAVAGDGRALVAFTDTGGAVRAVLIAPDGGVGPVHTLDTGVGQIGHVQVAFTRHGVPMAAWSGSGGGEPRVVAFDGEGNPGAAQIVSGPSGRPYLDTGGATRLVWAQTNGSRRSHNAVLGARVSDDGTLGEPYEVLPPVPHSGSYDDLALAGGMVAARRQEYGRGRGVDAILVGRTNGERTPRVIARAPKRNPDGPRQWRFFAHLSLAAGPLDTSVAVWTERRRGHPHRKGDVLRGAMLHGTSVGETIPGGFAGHDIAATAVAYSGRHPVVIAGAQPLVAATLKRSARLAGVARLPGTKSGRNENVHLVAVGDKLRAIWERSNTAIVTSSGRAG
jgi:hypothetical protein